MAYKVFSNGNALTGGELNTFLMNQSVISFASTTARDAAIPSPLEGQMVWLEDVNKYVYYTGSAWADLIPPVTPSFNTNAIINGGFDFWQRGTSFTPAASPTVVYTADRFAVQRDGTGATVTVSQQAFTPGTAPVAGYEAQYFLRFAQSVAGTLGTYNQLFQKVEDVRSFAGQSVTYSFWAKADAATTLQQATVQSFGISGSVDVVTLGSTQTITTSWARYTYTFTVPSVSGKTIGPGSFLQMGLSLANNTAKTVDIWGVQLESGSSVTNFKRAATTLQGELAACQRYYEKSYDVNTALGTATGNGIFNHFGSTDGSGNIAISVSFKVTKRGAPTISSWNAAGTASQWNYARSGAAASTASTFDRLANNGFRGYVNTGGNWVSANLEGHWSAESEL